jgi:transcriptional regulator with XRE-family HTH domain
MRRLMLGLSQSNVADALGVTFQQLQKYEKGTNRIGGSHLQHISQILQVPPAFFFEGALRRPIRRSRRDQDGVLQSRPWWASMAYWPGSNNSMGVLTWT